MNKVDWHRASRIINTFCERCHGKHRMSLDECRALATEMPFVPMEYWQLMQKMPIVGAAFRANDQDWEVMNGTQTHSECSEFAPGVNAKALNCMPFAEDCGGSGDPMFIQWNGDHARVLILYHDWFIADTAALVPSSFQVVAESLEVLLRDCQYSR